MEWPSTASHAKRAKLYRGEGTSTAESRRAERLRVRLRLPLKIKISTREDRPKFQGFSRENLINRLAASGIHLEQSKKARDFHKEIADAVADVFTSLWQWLVWSLTTGGDLNSQPVTPEGPG